MSKTTRFFKLKAASVAAAAGILVTGSMVSADSHSFSDVDSDDYYYQPVLSLTDQGVISGYPDNTFRPYVDVERQQVAAFLRRALDLPVPQDVGSVVDQFEDVDEDDYFAADIAATADAGIFSGYAGNFSPADSISRQQMASVLVRSYGLNEFEADVQDIYLDNVHPIHENDVQTLANLGLTTEFDNFRPADGLYRSEFVTFLYRTQELEFEDVDEFFSLNIYHTNDTHGRTDMYPRLKTTLDEAKGTYGDGLLLDAGDVFSGTLYFNEFRGQDAMEFMNYLGYDAMVFGNHEFDLGDVEEGHPELLEFVEAADFPFVGANMDFSGYEKFDHVNQQGGISFEAEGGMIYDAFVTEVDGEQVGIFGINTEDTVDISSPLDIAFSDYIEAAEDMVSQFEEAGINKIIALTHLGYDSDPSVGNDLLLAAHVEGIDIIIGGHSHTEVSPPTIVTENADGEEMEPTVIAQAGQYIENLGFVNVTFDENGVVVDADGELMDVSEREADADAADMLVPYTEAIEALQNEPAGSTVVSPLPNPRHGDGDEVSVRANETALGNLIADAQLDAARGTSAGADAIMAVQNGGGIRAAIPEGDVKIGELITVQPFGNRLTLLELSGAEIYEAFEWSLRNYPEENGGFLQVSQGTKVTYDSSRDAGDRVVSVEINVDGDYVELDMDTMYTIATNNFTATGGDGFEVFGDAYDDGRGTIIGFTDWEMLRDYMAKLGEVDYQVEGRIVDSAADDE